MKSYYILAQPVGQGKEEVEEAGGQLRYKVSSPPALLVEETYVHCCCCRLRRPTPNHVYHQLAGEACGRKQFHSLPTDARPPLLDKLI